MTFLIQANFCTSHFKYFVCDIRLRYLCHIRMDPIIKWGTQTLLVWKIHLKFVEWVVYFNKAVSIRKFTYRLNTRRKNHERWIVTKQSWCKEDTIEIVARGDWVSQNILSHCRWFHCWFSYSKYPEHTTIRVKLLVGIFPSSTL